MSTNQLYGEVEEKKIVEIGKKVSKVNKIINSLDNDNNCINPNTDQITTKLVYEYLKSFPHITDFHTLKEGFYYKEMSHSYYEEMGNDSVQDIDEEHRHFYTLNNDMEPRSSKMQLVSKHTNDQKIRFLDENGKRNDIIYIEDIYTSNRVVDLASYTFKPVFYHMFPKKFTHSKFITVKDMIPGTYYKLVTDYQNNNVENLTEKNCTVHDTILFLYDCDYSDDYNENSNNDTFYLTFNGKSTIPFHKDVVFQQLIQNIGTFSNHQSTIDNNKSVKTGVGTRRSTRKHKSISKKRK